MNQEITLKLSAIAKVNEYRSFLDDESFIKAMAKASSFGIANNDSGRGDALTVDEFLFGKENVANLYFLVELRKFKDRVWTSDTPKQTRKLFIRQIMDNVRNEHILNNEGEITYNILLSELHSAWTDVSGITY